VRDYIRHGVESEHYMQRLEAGRASTAKTTVPGERAR
jgi:hypothetical protein